MAIDPKTNLEELPEGYRWKIKRSLFMGRGWVVVKLQKKTRLGWFPVRRDETKPEYFSWSLEDLKQSWFDRDVLKARRKAKRKAARLASERHQRKLRRREEAAYIRSLFGVYPPKKFVKESK